MNKKGFTLVELMVVIVIIGVLAAVAIPKMMAATNKAKAGEGPQILRSIASMEAAYKAGNDTYINAAAESKGTAEENGPWFALGFDQNPFSRYFSFDVVSAAEYNSNNSYAAGDLKNTFIATATLIAGLGAASQGLLSVDQTDARSSTDANLGKLVPNWK